MVENKNSYVTMLMTLISFNDLSERVKLCGKLMCILEHFYWHSGHLCQLQAISPFWRLATRQHMCVGDLLTVTLTAECPLHLEEVTVDTEKCTIKAF
jgi:hypothetical protein